jgi:hypothetical protein
MLNYYKNQMSHSGDYRFFAKEPELPKRLQVDFRANGGADLKKV